MTTMNASRIAHKKSLGRLIREARLEAGYTYKELSELSGLPPGQINKLANDRIRTANPAHLAALAEPLGLTIYQLYAAAGYETPGTLTELGDELERKLRALPPNVLKRLDRYIDALSGDDLD